MKLFVLAMLVVVATAAPSSISSTSSSSSSVSGQMDIKDVEKLLAQIDAEEQKAQATKDPNVSQSWQKLLASFRQMTTAYVGVLNAVNTSLGLPKYPKLPGFTGRQAQRPQQAPAGIKQIQENLRQLQNSAVEVGQLVRRVVTNMSQDSRKTVLDQFRKFTDLWSSQLQDISGMLDNAARPAHSRQQDQQTLIDQINNYIRQVQKSISDFTTNLMGNIRNRLTPGAQTTSAPAAPSA